MVRGEARYEFSYVNSKNTSFFGGDKAFFDTALTQAIKIVNLGLIRTC